jgi:hypothetical protein
VATGHPARAFQINVNLPEVRLTQKDETAGVEQCVWGRAYNKPLDALVAKSQAAPGEKVVDPTVKGIVGNVYETLGLAAGSAKPGDVILIKAKQLRVEPIDLNKRAAGELTLKPFPDYHPVLTLGDTVERDAAIFRVHDGRLRLEGLEFRLRPERDEFTAQSVVEVAGDGQCVFKDCVVTLDESRGKPLALVMLGDSSRVTKTERVAALPVTPVVSIENCFIRGQGDLVSIRNARPLDLRVENTLVGLAGSFLNVEAGAREAPAPPVVQMKLTRVTAYLTDYLVRLRALTLGKEPVSIQVSPATNCLFASADGKPLVHLEGVDIGNDQMKSVLTWVGGRQNAYSKFQPMLDQSPQADEVAMPTMDHDSWKQFTGEWDASFPTPSVKFAEPPEAPLAGSLPRALPSHFRAKGDVGSQGHGADVEKLPRPVAQGENSQF